MSGLSDTAQNLKTHARDLGEQAQETVTSNAQAHAQHAKDEAVGRVQQAADATQAAADEFDPNSPQAQALHQVADAVEGVAQQLRGADVGQMMQQVSGFARQNPALFVGGAAVAGLALARFLKARNPVETHAYAADDDPWEAPAAPNLHTRGAYYG